MAGKDFVSAQLAAAGIKLADGHTLNISAGNRTFSFAPGVPVRVERSYEWNALLRGYVTPGGHPMFELAPDQPIAAVPPITPPAPRTVPAGASVGDTKPGA